MTNEDFKKVCEQILKDIKAYAPKDTGNLAYNAIKMKMPNAHTCEIYISGNSIKLANSAYGSYFKYGVAPYAPFTIEKWISPKWGGRKNPNEGWWQNALENALKKAFNDEDIQKG
jgi:hypothetical protein